MTTTNVVKLPSIQRMVCTECGAEANASCNCGKPYVPKATRAAEAVAAHPEKTLRNLSAETGIGKDTIAKARKQHELSTGRQLDERIGRDGKKRKLPAKSAPAEDEMPTEEEAEASYQETLYDLTCDFLKKMTDETRQRLFAHITRVYK